MFTSISILIFLMNMNTRNCDVHGWKGQWRLVLLIFKYLCINIFHKYRCYVVIMMLMGERSAKAFVVNLQDSANASLARPATGWSSATVIFYLFLTGTINTEIALPQSFLSSLHIHILIFWCLNSVRWKKLGFSGFCQNSVMALYCKDW